MITVLDTSSRILVRSKRYMGNAFAVSVRTESENIASESFWSTSDFCSHGAHLKAPTFPLSIYADTETDWERQDRTRHNRQTAKQNKQTDSRAQTLRRLPKACANFITVAFRTLGGNQVVSTPVPTNTKVKVRECGACAVVRVRFCAVLFTVCCV